MDINERLKAIAAAKEFTRKTHHEFDRALKNIGIEPINYPSIEIFFDQKIESNRNLRHKPNFNQTNNCSQLFEYFHEYIDEDCYQFMVFAYEQHVKETKNTRRTNSSGNLKKGKYLTILVYKKKHPLKRTSSEQDWQDYKIVDIPMFEVLHSRAGDLVEENKLAIRELYYMPNFGLMLYYEEVALFTSEKDRSNNKEERRTYVSYIDLKKINSHYKENRVEVTLDIEDAPDPQNIQENPEESRKEEEKSANLTNKPVIRMTPQRDYLIVRTDSTYITLIKTEALENHSLESLLSEQSSPHKIEFKAEEGMIITDFSILKIDTTPETRDYSRLAESAATDPPTCDLFVSYVERDVDIVAHSFDGLGSKPEIYKNMLLKIALVRQSNSQNNSSLSIADMTSQELDLGVENPSIGDIQLVYVQGFPIFCFIHYQYAFEYKDSCLVFMCIKLKKNYLDETALEITHDNKYLWRRIPLPKSPKSEDPRQIRKRSAYQINRNYPNCFTNSSIVAFQPSSPNKSHKFRADPLHLMVVAQGSIENIHFIKISMNSYSFKRMM